MQLFHHFSGGTKESDENIQDIPFQQRFKLGPQRSGTNTLQLSCMFHHTSGLPGDGVSVSCTGRLYLRKRKLQWPLERVVKTNTANAYQRSNLFHFTDISCLRIRLLYTVPPKETGHKGLYIHNPVAKEWHTCRGCEARAMDSVVPCVITRTQNKGLLSAGDATVKKAINIDKMQREYP
jgi:hypothetical protein